MVELATLATVASVVGASVSAAGTIAAGSDAKNAAEFKAKQEEQKANEVRASGSRQMLQERRQKDLALSTLTARAAASSGDTTDPTVVNLAGGIEREGEIQALDAFYKGENAARGYQDQAMATRASGASAQRASYYKAGGTILEGGSSLMKQYGNKVFG